MTYETDLQIGNIFLCVEITFTVTPVIRATYWEPAEGGEIEIENVTVTKVSGATYDLDRHEVTNGWLYLLDQSAWDMVEDNHGLYEVLHDIAGEDQYDV